MVKTGESVVGAVEERVVLVCPTCSETYSSTVKGGGSHLNSQVCSRCGDKLKPLTTPVATISSGAVRDRSN